MPGPDVEVIARAPAHDAPIAMPTAASSSSACTTAMRFLPVFGSARKRSEYAMRYSHSDDDGVIGYHAATVTPPMSAPSAAAWLPSTSTLPSTAPVIGSRRSASLLEEGSWQWSSPTLVPSGVTRPALGFARDCR